MKFEKSVEKKLMKSRIEKDDFSSGVTSGLINLEENKTNKKPDFEEFHNSRREENVELAVYQILENANTAIKQFICELNDSLSTENQGFFLLHYYGFLQALINQQDAIMYLYEMKTGEVLELPDYLEFTRKLKKQTVGHIPGYKVSEDECSYITDTYIASDNKFYYVVFNDRDDCDDVVYFDPVNIAEYNRKFVKKLLSKMGLNKFMKTVSVSYKGLK